MASPSKTDNIFFLFGGNPIIETAANTIQKSAEIDTSVLYMAQLFVHFAPTNAGAITVPPALYIESTPFPTGDAGWMPIIAPILFDTTTPATSGVDGSNPATTTTILESATGTLALEEIVFFKNPTFQNSEWGRVVGLTVNTSFVLEDGLTFAQNNTSTWFSRGQHVHPVVDLSGIKRLRAVVNNNRNATARACALRVGLVELPAVS